MTAHLLTGNLEKAESAVLAAIDSFDPYSDTEETLLRNTLHRAVRHTSSGPGGPSSTVPVELRAVLDLSPEFRRCYVLRVLAGLSRRNCAELLRLNEDKVDQYTYAAFERLAGVSCGS